MENHLEEDKRRGKTPLRKQHQRERRVCVCVRARVRVCVCVCVSLSRVWLFVSPPGSSVHGILQARTLERVVIPFSRGSSQSRYRTQVSCSAGRLYHLRYQLRDSDVMVVGLFTHPPMAVERALCTFQT